MAILTVQSITRAGLAATLSAADALGDSIPNTGVEWVRVVNGGVSTVTVTLDIRQTVDGQAVTDRTVSVPAGQEREIGPFPPPIYNDANGRATITYSGVTSVTVAAFALGA